jgi:hypothetical protein
MSSVNFDQVKAFRSYVESNREELVVQAFTDFEAADYATGIEGVKGKQILPTMMVGKLSKRWTKAFTPSQDAIKFGFETIETHKAKVELEIFPQDFENNHITGRKRAKGQGTDIPYEGNMFAQVSAKVTAEISDAFWNGESATTPTVDDDLNELFDGQRKLFKSYGQSGKIEAVAVPGGAYNPDNIIKHFKDMRLAQGAGYRKALTNAFLVSPEVANMYFDAVRAVKKGGEPTVRYVNGVRQIRTEDNTAWIAEIADLEGTEFAALLDPTRMFYAFDAFSDTNGFKMLETVRGYDFWMDYMFGVQLVVPEPYAVVYNLK